jgi:hypothetical protein
MKIILRIWGFAPRSASKSGGELSRATFRTEIAPDGDRIRELAAYPAGER